MALKWRTRIDRARARFERTGGNEGLTARDRKDAHHWPTCACGRQDPLVPRRKRGEPYDFVLSLMDHRFERAVRLNHFDLAVWALAVIDARVPIVVAAAIKAKAAK